ncbi:MAG: bacillithiol system redox-active protein YtxJ [Acidobacteria bacterium]|nr:bacillithiol system redox-active protein YtxJ [Acidobacteriota bacterium]
MPANFVTIESLDSLDALFDRSFSHPVVIFKHSNSCGISAHVMEQIAGVDHVVNVVVVQTNRDISNAVETRTGHRHQSPQAFVIRNGKAVYHATHYGIDADAIDASLRP